MGESSITDARGARPKYYGYYGYMGNASSSRGNTTSGHARVVKCYNCQGEGHMDRQCTQPKRPRNAAWYKEKAMLAEAQEAGQILDEEQLAFLDLDTYDSDCDDLSTAQAVLMANISTYGSDVISEVPNSETYMDDMDNQSVHALHDFEQSQVMDFFTDNEISSDSNIIPYSQYLLAEDFGKCFSPQQELSAEHAFWFHILNPSIESSYTPPVIVDVPKYFEINDLKARLQDKDTTICKLKDTIKSLRENTKEENVDHDKYDRAINKELEITRVCHKEQCDSLINKLNLKSVENEDLKARIQDKVSVITSLKNDLRKLKWKEIVENVVHTPSATTSAPGMFKLDLIPLPPRLLQNRE
ncbi:retrovirus-related pol polyprotein from transposon TNT 1-94 [Tanacetum coccineum]